MVNTEKFLSIVFHFTSALLHSYFIKVFKETKDRIIKNVKVLHDKGQPISNERMRNPFTLF